MVWAYMFIDGRMMGEKRNGWMNGRIFGLIRPFSIVSLRWGLSRNKKDKTPSQTDLPSSATKEEEPSRSQSSSRSTSDFPPVFHIKLRDHVLLEGDPVTLSCLPAGSPHPQITWLKGEWTHCRSMVEMYYPHRTPRQ